jgi:hypothetical protein
VADTARKVTARKVTVRRVTALRVTALKVTALRATARRAAAVATGAEERQREPHSGSNPQCGFFCTDLFVRHPTLLKVNQNEKIA